MTTTTPTAHDSCRHLHRRASAGGLENTYHQMNNQDFDGFNASPLTSRRPHSSMSGKLGTRSWHPSPFGSDDETEEHHFFKEERGASRRPHSSMSGKLGTRS